MPEILVIAHNIRSTHNVGAIFRTCEGLGVQKIILSGYTPYPEIPGDPRLPHERRKISAAIHKTALDAESLVDFEYVEMPYLSKLKSDGYTLAALEQTPKSIMLPDYKSPNKIALLLGEEVNGVSQELLSQCDVFLEIPMFGRKESFNVSVACGMALYALKFNQYS